MAWSDPGAGHVVATGATRHTQRRFGPHLIPLNCGVVDATGSGVIAGGTARATTTAGGAPVAPAIVSAPVACALVRHLSMRCARSSPRWAPNASSAGPL